MENENLFRLEMISKYCTVLKSIFRYLPWLEQHQGKRTFQMYQGDNTPSNSVPIPIYDSTLLSFVKEMQGTGLLNRNYQYVYSRNRIRTSQDELTIIEKTELKDIETIVGILSKYIYGGITKGILWNQAVEDGIFFHALTKMKDLLDVWDQPLA